MPQPTVSRPARAPSAIWVAKGVPWLGLAPFVETPHMFANMGDGTYQHSGLLAIRQAVAAKIPITYKILFNDAVAMTGGQAAEGGPSVIAIARQVAAEGVARIAVVADDADRLPSADVLPAGTTRHERESLDALQRELRGFKGVSVMIYDQVCATEKRRRLKRGTMQAVPVTVRINSRVCENCGDCTVQSNCIAIEPVATPFGRKRRISPTACNTDLSCLKGFCPSFVTSSSPPAPPADPWQAREAELAEGLAQPLLRSGAVWRGLFAGIGGGGIVTTGAIVAMAAHLDGLQVSTLDFTGLAQKNGAVVAHVQFGPGAIDAVRIAGGEADFMLASDMAVAASAGGAGVLQGRHSRGGQSRSAGKRAVSAFARPAYRWRAAPAHHRKAGGHGRMAAGGGGVRGVVRPRAGDEHAAAGPCLAARRRAGERDGPCSRQSSLTGRR